MKRIDVLGIAWQTLRGRRSAFVGTFTALAFGVTLLSVMGLVFAASVSGVRDGLGRYADAPVIVRADPTLSVPDPWGGESTEPLAQPDGLPAALVAAIGKAVGPGNAVPDRTFYATFYAQSTTGPAAADQVGHAWSDAAFGGYRLLAGTAPTGADQVVVPAAAGVAPGAPITVVTAQGAAGYTVSGVTADVTFESAVFFSDAEAARLSPPVDALVVYGSTEAAGTAATVARVHAVVDGRAQVLSGPARGAANPQAQQDAEQLVGVSTMLGLAAGVGGFVAVLVVGSTFAFSVGQRRRELALLRVSGATPGQIRGLVRAEAALVGAASGIVGCLAGPALAPLLARWMAGHGLAPSWFAVRPGVSDLVVLPGAFLLGLALALIGASTAAHRAGRISPIEALREARVAPRGGKRPVLMRLQPVAAFLSLALAGVMIGSCVLLPPAYWAQVAPAVVPALILCGLLLMPTLVPWFARAVTAPLLRGRGAGPMLMRADALGAVQRTVATAAPVLVTVGLFCCLWSTEASLQNAAQREAFALAANSDYVVLPQHGTGLGRAAVAAVAAVPGVETAVLTPTTVYTVPGHDPLIYPAGAPLIPYQATTVNPGALADGALSLPIVSGSAVGGPIAGGSGVVGSGVGGPGPSSIIVDQSWNRRVGDRVTVWLADGAQRTFTVVAVMKASIGGSGAILSDAYSGRALPDAVFVTVKQGAASGGRGATPPAALTAALRGQGATLVPTAAWTASVSDAQAAQLRQALFVVGGIAVIYTGIAVANTLAMSTRRRGRELAVLRLAGATRRQALGLVAAEAALVAGLGVAVAGAVVAVDLAGLRAALSHLVAHTPIVVPVGPFLAIAGACTAVALLAAVFCAVAVLRPPAIRLVAVDD